MSLVSAHHLAKSYGAQDVFADLSFSIPHQARIALVGPNGSGKTTLLCLIGGQEHPTAGTVHRAQRISIGYLPQQAEQSLDHGSSLWDAMLDVFADLLAYSAELERLEAAMAHSMVGDQVLERYGQALEAFERGGGYTYEARIEQVLAGLGFEEDEFSLPIGQLSGGQKTRALLARLLLEEPELLLLDEPTNHLDLAGVEWLEDYLGDWKGALVVVAHDRAFLDAFASQVWELDWGRLEQYRGNYTHYLEQKAERVGRQRLLYEQQQEFIARTETFIRRNIAGQRSREAKGRRKRLERLERIREPQEHRPMKLSLGEAARSGDLVFGLQDLVVGYRPAAPLLTAAELKVWRGETVALLGPNGCGKTSLVRTILGEVAPLAGRVRIGASVEVGYFPQGHTNLVPDRSVLHTVIGAGGLRISEARDFLGSYRFSGDDVFKRVDDLSGGEQARVALAVLVLQGANVLILDEPTSHLDIPSQEILETVLADFEGTVLLVTHDRYLIRALADRVWAIHDGELKEFRTYEEYREWRGQRRGRASSPERAARREAERRAARRAELEEQIQQLEVRQAELEAELAMASQAQEVARVRELGAEHGQNERQLEQLLAEWEEVA
ncbi:MAG: ABC-F family ATP-binding cassette domain-containing protein [Chloroflexota bacterium]|nr:ABC-F family ATP-binding cassette domain-containing protein [Chloroflexota bacterium]